FEERAVGTGPPVEPVDEAAARQQIEQRLVAAAFAARRRFGMRQPARLRAGVFLGGLLGGLVCGLFDGWLGLLGRGLRDNCFGGFGGGVLWQRLDRRVALAFEPFGQLARQFV